MTKAALPSFRGALEEFSPQALVPVPLGWWRRFRRGFNQSHVLAEQLSREASVSLPILTGLRRKEMPPQARRGRAERLRAMRGAFRVNRPKSFRGLRLLVIDDVLTTGATAESLAKSLLQAGAEAVQVWTLARTGRKE
ncbi:MAG: ComF family protein [Deltaproteobacteria bacterium]|nr:ComF family protein [Deltaproteobacteria bacterium]